MYKSSFQHFLHDFRVRRYVNTLHSPGWFLQLHITCTDARTVPTSVWFSVSFIYMIKVSLQIAVFTAFRFVQLHVSYDQRGNFVPLSCYEETWWSEQVWQKTKRKLLRRKWRCGLGVWTGLNELRLISRFVHFQQWWTLTLYLQRVISSVLDGFWLSLLIYLGTVRNP